MLTEAEAREQAREEAYRERTMHELELRCPSCGLISYREIIEGEPSPCPRCDEEERWERV